ncbi:hypothetical protein COO60DRAFT_1495917 [Scenedesmus sp. NREL 46B-D3]|nr:hypothetical protein COO60DRAFT_1495917 [Scenedesmus sp. NREL 46B-D3]
MLLRSMPASAAQSGGGLGGLRSITSSTPPAAASVLLRAPAALSLLPSAPLRRGVDASPPMLHTSESRPVASLSTPPSQDSNSSINEFDSDSTRLKLHFSSLILLRRESLVGVVTGSAKTMPAGPLSQAASPVAAAAVGLLSWLLPARTW